MEFKQLKGEYPIYTMTLQKSATSLSDVNALITYFTQKVQAHPVATFIGIFDHYSHTSALEDGHVDPKILDAKNFICCFGKDLSDPEVLAVRPRAIGIVEYQDAYVISFLKAPNPAANDAMMTWTTSLKDL